MGAGLVVEESKVTPNPEDLPSGYTACWYSVAGRPLGNGCGWQMGGAKAGLLRGVPSCPVPPTEGRYSGIVAGSGGEASSKGGMFQMDSPGGGGTYPDIPPQEVLRAVTP